MLVVGVDMVQEQVKGLGTIPYREITPDPLVETPACLTDRTGDFRQGGDGDIRHMGLVGRILDRERLIPFDPPTGDVRIALPNEVYRHQISPTIRVE